MKIEEDNNFSSLIFLKYILFSEYKKNIKLKEIIYGEYKKPYHNDFYFNISHSKNYICVAIGEKELGIDIEEERKYVHNFERKVFSKKDFELGISNVIETWVIKEAYSKYKGKGLLIKFSDISVEDIRSECYLYDLSNKNYYCYVAGEEKIENIKTIDYKLFKKYLKNEVKI